MVIAEYLNLITEKREPIGHGMKVFQEAVSLVSQDDVISVSCPEYSSPREKDHRNVDSIIPERDNVIKKYLIQIRTIRKAFRVANESKDKIVWFTNVHWLLPFLMGVLPIKKHVILTMFRDIAEDTLMAGTKLKRIKHHYVRKGISKAAFLIVTNPSLSISERQLHIPDYYYTEEYEKYQKKEKEDRVVCLGIIRETKDIRGLIGKFRNTDIPVLIAGRFDSQDTYQWAMENKSDNIIIENRKIAEEEYYNFIAGSRFVILPYKTEWCRNATSGILLEAVFLSSIPIGPRILLDNNQINGIGYETLEDLPGTYAELEKLGESVKNDILRYKKETVQKRLQEAIKKWA